MEKPMQFVIVRDVPFVSSGAFWATRVENSGESAITAALQIKRNVRSNMGESLKRNIGEARQHKHEISNAVVAVRFVPHDSEISPPATQEILPMPIIKNDNSEMSRSVPGWILL